MRIVLFSSLAALCGCLTNDFPALPSASGDAATSPAVRSLTWPPDGSSGVPPVPELLAVWLAEGEARHLALDADGTAIDLTAVEADCEELGFEPGWCRRLLPTRALPDSGTLTIVVDDHAVATLSLGVLERDPTLVPLDCAVFERQERGFCLDVDDRSARLRALLDRSARVVLTTTDGREVFLAPAGRVDILLPLAHGCSHEIDVALVTLDGRSLGATLEVHPERDLAPVHLVESFPNPRGPEPAQEYVELLNVSAVPVSLAGFRLTDDAHRLGDALPAEAVAPPHGRALLVPSSYDETSPHDAAPPWGATLIRLDASLANAGLSNSGEPLYLLDARHRRVSAMPASPVPPEGMCLHARSLDDRRPSPGRFAVGTCTPGR
jgi:hypothetical protein